MKHCMNNSLLERAFLRRRSIFERDNDFTGRRSKVVSVFLAVLCPRSPCTNLTSPVPRRFVQVTRSRVAFSPRLPGAPRREPGCPHSSLLEAAAGPRFFRSRSRKKLRAPPRHGCFRLPEMVMVVLHECCECGSSSGHFRSDGAIISHRAGSSARVRIFSRTRILLVKRVNVKKYLVVL